MDSSMETGKLPTHESQFETSPEFGDEELVKMLVSSLPAIICYC